MPGRASPRPGLFSRGIVDASRVLLGESNSPSESAMDEHRLIDIYRETVQPLYGTVAGWTSGDRALTEDVVQETFLRAVKSWRNKGLPDNPIAWLRTVARNVLISAARTKRPVADGDRVDAAADPDGGSSPEDLLAIGEGMEALNQDQARVLEAFHVEGRTMRDIARQEGISERAVEGRLRRAREAMRQRLTPTEQEPETNP